MEWFDFKTAPIDRQFIAYCPEKGMEFVIYTDGRLMLHFDRLFLDDVYATKPVTFTHWCEAPEPPTDA